MKSIRVEDFAAMKEALAGFGRNVVFRGQTQHFGTAEVPSATTSFARQGCISTEMLRWGRYADDVLGAFTGQHANLRLMRIGKIVSFG